MSLDNLSNHETDHRVGVMTIFELIQNEFGFFKIVLESRPNWRRVRNLRPVLL